MYSWVNRSFISSPKQSKNPRNKHKSKAVQSLGHNCIYWFPLEGAASPPLLLPEACKADPWKGCHWASPHLEVKELPAQQADSNQHS